MRWTLTAVGPVLTAIVVFAAPGSPPVVIDTLSPDVVAGEGTGWGRHPDSTPDATVALVEGPLAPPLGRGSMSFVTPASSDLALGFAVPTGAPGQDLPTPVPWSSLSASYSTFTFATVQPESNVPILRLVGFQSLIPAPTGFTTLSFAPDRNGTVESGVWQSWTLGPDSIVFQSNTADSFCTISASCTLAEFIAQYPAGAWGQIQVGIGTGAPVGASGFADAVVVHDGTTADYSYDFEVPASALSTAAVAPGAASATGGSATVSLAGSAVAGAETLAFTIESTLPDGTLLTAVQDRARGATGTIDMPVPFGTTRIRVSLYGVVLAEGDVTFAESPPPNGDDPAPTDPAAPPPPGAAPPADGGLAPTGPDEALAAVWGASLLAAGLLALVAARVRDRRARSRER
ncbi:hypothetical protein AB1K54_07225 [Microbacterium sp. BWT-B31]|uniref:hypothetical protein n=1 Tax=Microbacterium sp. BWT-B31 TaxID=3232072 RepID=UPI0035293015